MIMISTPLKRDYIRGGKADKKGWLENIGKRLKTQREKSENIEGRECEQRGRKKNCRRVRFKGLKVHRKDTAWTI